MYNTYITRSSYNYYVSLILHVHSKLLQISLLFLYSAGLSLPVHCTLNTEPAKLGLREWDELYSPVSRTVKHLSKI